MLPGGGRGMWWPVRGIENFLFKAGPIRVSGGYELDGPCDLDRLGAEIETALDRAPHMSSGVRRIGPWHFWTGRETIDLSRRISIVEDASITGADGLARIAEKARLLPPPGDAGDWRLTIVNPRRTGGPDCRSLVFIHFNHAIADALRMQQLVVGLDRNTPADARPERVRWPDIPQHDGDAFFSLPEGDERPVRLHMFSLDSASIRGAGDQGTKREAILAAVSDILADRALFPTRADRTPVITCTFFTRKNTNRWQMGNYATGARFEVPAANHDNPPDRRRKVVQLSEQRANLRMQVVASLFPAGVLARRVEALQARSDAWMSLVPMGRAQARLGGRRIRSVFGVMPLLGDMPLTLGALSYRGRIHFTLTPGTGFGADVADLGRRFQERLMA